LEAHLLRKASYQDLIQTLEMFRKKLDISLDISYETISVKDKQKVARALIEDIVIFPNEIEIRHTIPSFASKGLLCSVGGDP
jgi:hypothetical protein